MTTELDNLHNEADGANENNQNIQDSVNESTNQDSEAVESKDEAVEEVVEETVSEETVEQVPSSESEDSDSYKVETVEEEEEGEEDLVEEIPFKNYAELPLSVLIGEAKDLLKNHPARKLREHFNQIREAVKELLDEDEKAKKEAFVESGGDPLEFHYDHTAKREFNAVYNDYRKQLDVYYKELEKTQLENLKEREAIIEELKALYIEPNEDGANIFSKFRELKTRWHNAGMVPKAQAGNVFRTYFHHLDNFYEYLDLNKELREMDYAHNLQVRESIIKRAEELVEEENVQKALNELQYLHRLWKEEAVPVAEDLREPTWQKFKELTNKIHDRKSEISEKIKQEQNDNLKAKQEIIDRIQALIENADKKSHGEWQSGIKKLNELREKFLATGRVPKEFNQKMWNEFKAATREFNHKKNDFYKVLKTEQQTNLDKKMALLEIAKEHANSTNWNESVQVIKRIQADWKKIGHVPRKYSDSIWKDFKDACNHFFDKYKERDSHMNQAYENNFVEKEALLEEVRAFKASGDVQADLAQVNEFNVRWSAIGKVPAAKMSINSDFNKVIGQLVKSFGLSENEIQDFKMAALVDQIKTDQDGRLLDDEIRKTRKQIEELEKEINQLETNIGFFANAKEDNPLLRDVYKQIENKRDKLTEAEIRLRRLHQIDFDDEVEDEASNEDESQEGTED